LTKGNYWVKHCFELRVDVVVQSFGESSPYEVSQYDIRRIEDKDAPRNFPPQHKIVETYLGGFPLPEGTMATSNSDVLAAIHASLSRAAGQIYQECSDPPFFALAPLDGMGVMDDVRYLLESGIKLLFFNGIMDLICNHVGNEIALEKLSWSHQKDYVVAPRYAWMSGGNNKVAGYMKEFKNLSYLKVLERWSYGTFGSARNLPRYDDNVHVWSVLSKQSTAVTSIYLFSMSSIQDSLFLG
jgi:hypothetical protein